MTIAVVADDLIWGSRLVDAVRRAGGHPRPIGSASELAAMLDRVSMPPSVGVGGPVESALAGAIVDLLGRRFDAVAIISALVATGLPVIAVAEHDDQETRRRALDAGASRVFSYNKFFADGPRLVGEWLAKEGVRSA